MKSEIKSQWVEALRSGKYEQGRSALKTQNGKFCCLGVLCDILDPEGWNARGEYDGVVDRYLIWSENNVAGYLDEDTLIRVGLDNYEQYKLANMNDSGASFEDIAQYIEENL